MAQLHYLTRGNMVKEDTMTVTDDWVFDTYGMELANRLIDQGEHKEFITPVDENGKLVMLPLED